MLGWSLMKLFSALATPFKVDAAKFELSEKEAITQVEGILLFSLVWSVGCSVDGEGRQKIDAFMKESCAGTVPAPYNEEGERGAHQISSPYPKEHSM
jgi:dynein heavy chain